MELQFPLSVAYNIREKKVGCVIAQAALGATLSGGQVSLYFDDRYWELNPTKCQLYIINSQTEFDFMIQTTKDWYENQRIISQHQFGRDQSQDS